jgi:hypothetical protein
MLCIAFALLVVALAICLAAGPQNREAQRMASCLQAFIALVIAIPLGIILCLLLAVYLPESKQRLATTENAADPRPRDEASSPKKQAAETGEGARQAKQPKRDPEREAKRLAEERAAKERQERAEKEAKEREAKRRPLAAQLNKVKRILEELARDEARLRKAALQSAAADRPDIRKRVDEVVKERETMIAERDRLEGEIKAVDEVRP